MNVQEWIVKTKTKNLFAPGSTKLAQNLVKNNEEILFAFNANVGIVPTLEIDSAFNLKNRLNGVIVLTKERLIYASKNLWEEKTKFLDVKNIQSIDTKKGMFSCSLRIKGITESFVIDGTKELLNEFQKILENLIEASKNVTTTIYAPAQLSLKEQIQELKELLDDGIITQEEFEQKKKQILGL